VRFIEDVEVYGWLSQGITLNADSPTDRFNGPNTFNDRSNEYQLNQLYTVMERSISDEGSSWDLGGRVDLLYGTDYFFTTALGLETHRDGSPRWNSGNGPRGSGAALYGLALPQLYAEVMVPVGTGLDVKLGHFYSILGYESVMDPVNFFYSRSYAKQYGEPITETGLISNYWLSERWNIQAGFTRGANSWEDINRDIGFLGGLTWSLPDDTSSVRFAISTGDEDPAGRNNRTVYSLVYRRELTPKLTYVFQHDFGTEAGAAVDSNGSPKSAKWYDIAQYLLYSVNDRVAWGMRFEWFRDQDNVRVLGIPFDALTEGGNLYELTAGVNWEPRASVLFRSEVRWDWSDVSAPGLGIAGLYDSFQDKQQFTWATNLVLTF